MIAMLRDAYKLADNEALKIAGLPQPKHDLARTIQVFATALVYMAHQARHGHQALEWMRAQPCLFNTTLCQCPRCEASRIDKSYNEGTKKLVIPPPAPPKIDLTAPLLESTFNPRAQ